MEHHVSLFMRSVFPENLALAFFLGICVFLSGSENVRTALRIGLALLVIQSVTVPLNSLIYYGVLKELNLTFLSLIVFIAVIAGAAQLLEFALDRYFPPLQLTLVAFLPLLAINCAVLGGSLFMAEREYSFAESLTYGFASGVGWALAITGFAGIREKLKYADVPDGLQGLGIAFITAGLMSLAFRAFAGM